MYIKPQLKKFEDVEYVELLLNTVANMILRTLLHQISLHGLGRMRDNAGCVPAFSVKEEAGILGMTLRDVRKLQGHISKLATLPRPAHMVKTPLMM